MPEWRVLTVLKPWDFEHVWLASQVLLQWKSQSHSQSLLVEALRCLTQRMERISDKIPHYWSRKEGSRGCKELLPGNDNASGLHQRCIWRLVNGEATSLCFFWEAEIAALWDSKNGTFVLANHCMVLGGIEEVVTGSVQVNKQIPKIVQDYKILCGVFFKVTKSLISVITTNNMTLIIIPLCPDNRKGPIM